jgi:hypothetical protein
MTIQAIVRNGQLELESPLDLPDGTVLTIPVPATKSQEPERSQESIEEWECWYKSLEPWHMSAEERAAWDAAREEDKKWELSQWESRSKAIENLFP